MKMTIFLTQKLVVERVVLFYIFTMGRSEGGFLVAISV